MTDPDRLADPVTPGLRARVAGKRGDDMVWMPAGELRALLAELDRRGQIEQRAREIAEANTSAPTKNPVAIRAARHILGESS